MGRPSFPLVIRLGPSRATVYETPIRHVPHFTLGWYEGRTRKRKLFADLEAAKREGQNRVNSLARGEAEVIRLSGLERLEYLRARDCLKDFAMPLDVVAAEYGEAKRLLKGTSLLDAVRHYASTKLVDRPRKTVSEVFQEMLQAKLDEGLSDRYLKDLKTRLGDFATTFQSQISDVTGSAIRPWLQNKEIANRTRNKLTAIPAICGQ